MASSDVSGSLDFATPLLCQQLWNGNHQAFPVAAPALTSHGTSQEACLSEQRLFLEDYLSRAEPDVLAHFALPGQVRVELIEVLAPRADLPKRLFKPNTLELVAVVVPLAQETWVFVPALDHTVYVAKNYGAQLLGTVSVDSTNGVAVFPDVAVDRYLIDSTLVARSTGAESAESAKFSVAP